MTILELLKSKQNDIVQINEKYVCTILDEVPFKTFIKDTNSSTYYTHTNVKVDDAYNVILSIQFNPDLDNNFYASICFYENNECKRIGTVTSISKI